jgi:uncharacterized protein YecE (DUF72 family)
VIYVGTAAWNIPKEYRAEFPAADSILESYARRLPAVEINSSFYRHHQAKTYARWAESVPDDFRFSVKLAREFTHRARLILEGDAVARFRRVVRDYQELGAKLGCLLVQLPPSLKWEAEAVRSFLFKLRECYADAVALEPRHLSWNGPAVDEMLREFRVSRVWADPAPIPNPKISDFTDGNIAYYRLHGSPEIYKSDYDDGRLKFYRSQLEAAARVAEQIWCIFDNTTYGYATANALALISGS